MKERIEQAKGFIQTPLLIGIIISIIVVVGVGYGIFKNHIATTSARATVEEFMKARIERNMEKASSFLTDNAKKQYSSGKLTLLGVSNPHFVDFKILEIKKLSDTQFRFKVRIDEGYTGQGKVGYFDETLTVVKKKGRYLIDSVKRGEYTNTFTSKNSQATGNKKYYSGLVHDSHLYFNTDYGFTLISDPNQSNPYTDYPDVYSFQVIPITKGCGDITSTCPPASIIPGFRKGEDEQNLLKMKKITFPNNPVTFCFIKGSSEYGAGSVYESYYYITTTKDNRCFAMHFVVHKTNCEMFGNKEQIDKCRQEEERKDQIPNEYIKTFKFVQ